MGNLFNLGGFGMASTFGIFFVLLLLWSVVWKGLGLWHAAKRKDRGWFIALLVINTAGILEIIYLFVILKMSGEEVFGSSVSNPKSGPIQSQPPQTPYPPQRQ